MVVAECMAVNDLHLCSDHRAVFGMVNTTRPRSVHATKQRYGIGWKPRFDSDGVPREYHSKLADGIREQPRTMKDRQTVVYQCANECSADQQRAPKKLWLTAEYQDLLARRRLARTRGERRDISKAIAKECRKGLRRWRTQCTQAIPEKLKGLHCLANLNSCPSQIYRVRNC